MAILGNVIKTAIELKEKLTPETAAIPAQEQVLTNLLKTAANTAFGRQYGFSKILSNAQPRRAFAQAVSSERPRR